MQHMGDLQPLGQPDFLSGSAPLGRYSARRSRWRFAVGSLEVGFDRASESIEAETPRTAQAAHSGFGRRLMILVGTATTVLLTIALAGLAWSSRGSFLAGETLSAAIVDRGDALPRHEAAAPTGKPILIPTAKPENRRLIALIEQRRPAPAAAPAPRAAVQIANGRAIAPRPAIASSLAKDSPDEAIVSSGNYLLIPAVSRAVGQAMASGEAQNWTAGDYHGLVVVGDAERRDGKVCRQGTVLLRDGSTQGRTQKFERCV